MITINKLTIIDCKIGISAPRTANMSVNGAYFERVGTCYDFRDEPPINHNFSKPKTTINLVKKSSSSNLPLEMKSKKCVKHLFNLEIKSIINNDLGEIKKIRKLKMLIGSKCFESIYSTLHGQG